MIKHFGAKKYMNIDDFQKNVLYSSIIFILKFILVILYQNIKNFYKKCINIDMFE